MLLLLLLLLLRMERGGEEDVLAFRFWLFVCSLSRLRVRLFAALSLVSPFGFCVSQCVSFDLSLSRSLALLLSFPSSPAYMFVHFLLFISRFVGTHTHTLRVATAVVVGSTHSSLCVCACVCECVWPIKKARDCFVPCRGSWYKSYGNGSFSSWFVWYVGPFLM